MARKVLSIRYSILPLYYTLFYKAHTPVTMTTPPAATVTRPLLFEFPSDVNTFGVHTQFLIGPVIMISPVTTQGTIHDNNMTTAQSTLERNGELGQHSIVWELCVAQLADIQLLTESWFFLLPHGSYRSTCSTYPLYFPPCYISHVGLFFQVLLRRMCISPEQDGLIGTTSPSPRKKAGKW